MTNEIQCDNDAALFLSNSLAENCYKILPRKEQLLNLKNISLNNQNRSSTHFNLIPGVKIILCFIIYVQFFCSTSAYLYGRGQILDAQDIIRDGNQLEAQDENHVTTDVESSRNVLINCYLKIHLKIEDVSNFGLPLVKDDAEMKKMLMMYFGGSVKWKVIVNDINSNEKKSFKHSSAEEINYNQIKNEGTEQKAFYFEKVINPYTFSLITKNENLPQKASDQKTKDYIISAMLRVEIPFSDKNKVYEQISHRQRTLVVTFVEKELCPHINDDVLYDPSNFNSTKECSTKNSNGHFCENKQQKVSWRTKIKSRRLVNIPYNVMTVNEKESSPLILPVYLESRMNMTEIVVIKNIKKQRRSQEFYYIKSLFSLKSFLVVVLSGLVCAASIRAKQFFSNHYEHTKYNDNYEDATSLQQRNNIEGALINESVRKITETITKTDGTKTTTTTTTIFTVEKKQLSNNSNDIKNCRDHVSHQDLSNVKFMNEGTLTDFNTNALCNSSEDISNNSSSNNEMVAKSGLDSYSVIHRDPCLNHLESNKGQQAKKHEREPFNQISSPLLSELDSISPYRAHEVIPNKRSASIFSSHCSKGNWKVGAARESLNATRSKKEPEKEHEKASYVTTDPSSTSSPLQEKDNILQPVSKVTDVNFLPKTHNTAATSTAIAKVNRNPLTAVPDYISNQVSESSSPIIEASKTNKNSSNSSYSTNEKQAIDKTSDVDSSNSIFHNTLEILPTTPQMETKNMTLTQKTTTSDETLNFLRKGDDRFIKRKYCNDSSPYQGNITNPGCINVVLRTNMEKKSNYAARCRNPHSVRQNDQKYIIEPFPEVRGIEQLKKEHKKSCNVATDPLQDSRILQAIDKTKCSSTHNTEVTSTMIARESDVPITPSLNSSSQGTDSCLLTIETCEKNCSSSKIIKKKKVFSKAFKDSSDSISITKENISAPIPFQDVNKATFECSFQGIKTTNMKLTPNTKSNNETGHLGENYVEVENIDSDCDREKFVEYDTNKINIGNDDKSRVKNIMNRKRVKRKNKLAQDCYHNFHDDDFSLVNGIALFPNDNVDNKEGGQKVDVVDKVINIRTHHSEEKLRKRKIDLEKSNNSNYKRVKKLFSTTELETLNQIDNFLNSCESSEVKCKYTEDSTSLSCESIEVKSKETSVVTENTSSVTSRNQIKKKNTNVQYYVDDKGCLKDDSCFRFSQHVVGNDDSKRDT